jgi:hypothetical protein
VGKDVPVAKWLCVWGYRTWAETHPNFLKENDIAHRTVEFNGWGMVPSRITSSSRIRKKYGGNPSRPARETSQQSGTQGQLPDTILNVLPFEVRFVSFICQTASQRARAIQGLATGYSTREEFSPAAILAP